MNKESAYIKAEQRIKELKSFYNHVFGFIIYFVVWMVFYGRVTQFFLKRVERADEEFRNWLEINMWFVPGIWALILIIHGAYVYTNKFNFLKNWEHKKMEEFLSQENDLHNTTRWE